MKRSMITKAAAFFLSICLLTGMIPAEAQAVEGSSAVHTINFNKNGVINGINNPETTNTTTWTGSKVYFGLSGSSPILWRILDKKAVTDKNIMLLHTDALVAELPFAQNSNQWQNSVIQLYLNDRDQFLKGFSSEEQKSIYPCDKKVGEDTTEGNISFTNPALNGSADSVFLLSAEEALNKAYGYENAEARKRTDGAGYKSWWLRSGVIEEEEGIKAGIVDKDGKLASQIITDESNQENVSGIAPALYLDTSQILFISQASVPKPDAFTAVGEVTGNPEWKLTLKQPGNLYASLAGGSSRERGSEIEISHEKAASVLKDATQVSAILIDESGALLYYGRINDNAGAESSKLILPSDLIPGNYRLYVFAEDINGLGHTDYASELGGEISLSVKAVPIIKTLPSTSSITYGQSLGDVSLEGGIAEVNGSTVEGTFRWKDGTIFPSTVDSNNTQYEVIFTPNDTAKYDNTIFKIPINVVKAQTAPNMPQASVTVAYGVNKVNKVPLPEDWSWRTQDADKELVAGGVTQAIAVYKDTQNYTEYQRTVTISRSTCIHSGGTASCIKQAICDTCKQPYGSVDSGKHGTTEIRNSKNPDCTQKGYSGDNYCKDCGKVVTKGAEIAATGHSYTEKITKTPTLTEEGIKTFTCSKCGHQYTDNMGKHNHYYNGTRTLKWIGCEQKGEIEHYCECGDAYVDVTPALGHAYEAKVTKKATSEQAGVKTFTCSRCGHAYTEAIPKLSGGSTGSSNSKGNNGGTNNNGGGNAISDRMPYIATNSSISGWTDINKMIAKASDGDTITINMNESLILPKKTIESIKGKNITLLLDIGNDMKWSICGADMTAESIPDFNLRVTKNSNAIPSDLVTGLAGELNTMQISFAHDGKFGGTANLQILVDSHKSGYYANLFYYNEGTNSLEYVASAQMDGKGIASLPMTHASEYLIVVDTKIMDGSEPVTPDTTEPSEPSLPEETIPVDTPTVKENNGLSPTIFIIIGLVVLGIGLIFIMVLRARSKEEDYYSE